MRKIEEIFSMIKEDELIKLGKRYLVDRHNTKLSGLLIFKGLMRLILMGKKPSLRMLEMLINQDRISLNNEAEVTYSGLSKRLKVIKVDYFKNIYEDLLEKCLKEIDQKDSIKLHRFDSTVINLSGYLIKDGLKIGGKSNDSQIKVSIGLKNQLPTSIRFCQSLEESSEDIALVRAINEARIEREDVLLFDRGINKGSTFEAFNNKEYKFVTRVKIGRRYKLIEKNVILLEAQDGALIQEDIIINIYGEKMRHPIDSKLRLIKLTNKNGSEIWFLSNLFDMPAFELTNLYRRRWDIEIFFKFLKQNLGYKHFLSHSMNGMKVYIYMILITALLFLVYKIRNKLNGFKIALFQFTLDLEKSFVRNLILLAGGNPDTVKPLL